MLVPPAAVGCYMSVSRQLTELSFVSRPFRKRPRRVLKAAELLGSYGADSFTMEIIFFILYSLFLAVGATTYFGA